MFKNQSTFIDDKAIHQDLSQEDDYAIENIPVHTMEKDIRTIENPALEKTFYPESSEATLPPQELSTKQKSSPFLNPSENSPITSGNRPKSNPDYAQVNKAIQPKINSISQTNASSSSSLILAIMVIITLLIGAGSYYFITAQKTANQEQEPVDSTPENKEEVEKVTVISATKVNYIVIDIASIDPNIIKKALEKNAQEVMASGAQIPVEFIILDSQNNPIGFSDFAKMAGLTLSEKITSLLEKDFSLFFFNDTNNIGFALNLKTTDPVLLKSQLAQEETFLYQELDILLPYSKFTPPSSPFQSTTYKNHEIRYINLISPQNLSIDYTLQETRLIIATTKLTMESLLDKFSSQQQ